MVYRIRRSASWMASSVGLMLAFATLPARAEAGPPLSEAEVRSTIKQMVGCFQVRFHYVEDGAHDAIYPPVYERADLANEEPLTIHRTLVLGSVEQRHWSEVWTPASDGQWQQEVTGPFGDFRYKCAASWELNQWSCVSKGAAKPRRDEARPYATLDRSNTLQLNAKRWVQVEQNRKLTADGQLYSVEVGWNQYDLVDAKFCQLAP